MCLKQLKKMMRTQNIAIRYELIVLGLIVFLYLCLADVCVFAYRTQFRRLYLVFFFPFRHKWLHAQDLHQNHQNHQTHKSHHCGNSCQKIGSL